MLIPVSDQTAIHVTHKSTTATVVITAPRLNIKLSATTNQNIRPFYYVNAIVDNTHAADARLDRILCLVVDSSLNWLSRGPTKII